MKISAILVLGMGITIWGTLAVPPPSIGAEPDELLVRGRQAFYSAVDQKDQIDSALHIFEKIQQHDPVYEGLATTYIGAIYTLKGKHALLPQHKYRYVLEGLEIMEQGLHENPDNLEALFIFGMTCYHLPFFFLRRAEALQTFHHIVDLLEQQYPSYDAALVLNVAQFLNEQVPLSARETHIIQTIEADISGK